MKTDVNDCGGYNTLAEHEVSIWHVDRGNPPVRLTVINPTKQAAVVKGFIRFALLGVDDMMMRTLGSLLYKSLAVINMLSLAFRLLFLFFLKNGRTSFKCRSAPEDKRSRETKLVLNISGVTWKVTSWYQYAFM